MQALDNALFLGRKLSVRWYQPERDSAQQQAVQQSTVQQAAAPLSRPPGMGMDLQGLLGSQAGSMLLSQLAAAASAASAEQEAAASLEQAMVLSKWMSAQRAAAMPVAAAPMPVHEEAQPNAARWSALVNMWLNNYEQVSPSWGAEWGGGWAARVFGRPFRLGSSTAQGQPQCHYALLPGARAQPAASFRLD